MFSAPRSPIETGQEYFKKDNIVLEGLPWCLSGPQITNMLNKFVLNENVNEFIGYGKEHN
jgi:hypothetical protein